MIPHTWTGHLAQVRQFAKDHWQALLTVAGAITLWLTLMELPKHMVRADAGSRHPRYPELVNENRRTMTQLAGAVGGALALYLLWRRTKSAEKTLHLTQESLRISQENLQTSQETLRVTRDSKLTERFAKAVEQLGALDKEGKPVLEVRFGGIYALERIARESRDDHQPIMEILTAYVRQNAPWHEPVPLIGEDVTPPVASVPELRKDIQAILTVLGRRTREHESASASDPAEASFCLDLRGADLRRASLDRAHLQGITLRGAHLERANLSGAHLEGAFLSGTHLEGAFLHRAHLEGASMREVHLEGASMREVHLEGAYLREAHLEQADLRGANLERAYLGGARLEQADLGGAHLERADLRGVNLAEVFNLTRKQLTVAITDKTTIPPAYQQDESQAASSGAS